MEGPKVSVMVPTYNHQDFIRESLDSILGQSYPSLEIIVTDDGSSDDTCCIMREYQQLHPDRIIPVFSEKNTGIAANVNRGLVQVTGKYIAWLAGDDLMMPDKIEKQVRLLEANPDAAGCIHDVEIFDSDTGKTTGLFSTIYNGRSNFDVGGVELWFRPEYFMPGISLMIRTSTVPLNRFDTRLRYTNEWVFHVEVFRQGQCLVIDEALARYRRHDKNVTGSDDLRQIALEDNLIAAAIIEARYPELAGLVRKKRQILLLGAFKKSWPENRKLALQYAKAAFMAGHPLSLPWLVSSWLWQRRNKRQWTAL